MRVLLLLLAAFVALVAAAGGVVPASDEASPAPQKRLLGICIFGISWLGDCNRPSRPRPTPTRAPTTTADPEPSPTPSFETTDEPTATSASESATDSASGSTTDTSASTSGTVDTASSSPTSAPLSSASSAPPTVNSTTLSPVDRFTYTYPQPALPWKTNTASGAQFTVANGANISPYPTTRRYNFNLEYTTGSPDGFTRRMTTINGQFPGPLIEANQGDTLEITVRNSLDIPQSIHWHGMRQNGSNSEDGVPGISQCPIPPGRSYTYRFKLESEMGTFWYHSHYGNTLADGVIGGLIVHSRNDPLKQGKDYDEDRIIYLTDWQTDQSDVIVHRLHDLPGQGYRGSPVMGPPDSILINGVGQADCSKTQKGVRCIQKEKHRITAARGRRVRFRVIHTGSHALLRLSIDRHPLVVIEADDAAIQPVQTNELPLWPGQRYSVVITLDKGNVGDSFFIRAVNAAACIVPYQHVEGRAVLQYTNYWGSTWYGNPNPVDQRWGDLKDPKKELCHDFDHYHTVAPLINTPPPAERIGFTIWNSAFGVFKSPNGVPFIGFGLNGTSYTNYINVPLLKQIQEGRELDKEHVPSITWNEYGAYDLVLNQHDPSPLAHPFHLHGRPFYVMARGEGALTQDTVPSVQLNTVNPPRRDVLSIAGSSWAIIRVVTDTPGVWPLHCHIGWHLAVGKLGVIVVRPDEIRKQYQSPEWHGLCDGTDPGALGPGRRSFEETSVAEPQVTTTGAVGRRSRHRRIAAKRQDVPAGGELQGQYWHNATDWWLVGTPYRGKLNARGEREEPEDPEVTAGEEAGGA